MKAIKFNPEQHYSKIVSWWESHDYTPTPLDDLPDDGIVILNDNIEVFAAWLIKTDTNSCILEYAVSNPECSNRVIYKAVFNALEILLARAKSLGYKKVIGLVDNNSILKIYKRIGFVVSRKKLNYVVGGI